MKALLMSMGLWKYIEGSSTEPADSVLSETWHEKRTQCMGNILLCTIAPIQQELAAHDDPKKLWEKIKTAYSETTLAGIYKDFHIVSTITFNPNQHPGPQLDKVQAAFARLTSSNISIPDILQGLIILNCLPSKWEHLVPIITQSSDTDDFDLNDVRQALLAQWESKQNQGKGKHGNQPHNANKLSAVKCKHGNPNFSNQEQGS
jgi:hypothetical protein